MRKEIVIFAVVLFWGIGGIKSHSIAQEQRNFISINPVGIIFGIQNVEFERVLSRNSGIALYLAYSGFAEAKISDIRFEGSEQRVTYRYYIKQNAPKGFWLGGSFAYSSGNVVKLGPESYIGGQKVYIIEEYAWNISMLALGVEVGYRWILGNFNIAPMAMYRFPLTDNLLGTKTASGGVKIPFVAYGIGINIGWGW